MPRAPTTTRSAPLRRGEQGLEDRPLEDGGAGAAVHAGLGDRPEHLGLEPVVGGELGARRARGAEPSSGSPSGASQDADRDDGRLAAGGLAQRPHAARRGRRPIRRPRRRARGSAGAAAAAQVQRLDARAPAPARTSTDRPTAAPSPGPSPAPGAGRMSLMDRSSRARRRSGRDQGPGTRRAMPSTGPFRRVLACVSARRVIGPHLRSGRSVRWRSSCASMRTERRDHPGGGGAGAQEMRATSRWRGMGPPPSAARREHADPLRRDQPAADARGRRGALVGAEHGHRGARPAAGGVDRHRRRPARAHAAADAGRTSPTGSTPTGWPASSGRSTRPDPAAGRGRPLDDLDPVELNIFNRDRTDRVLRGATT